MAPSPPSGLSATQYSVMIVVSQLAATLSLIGSGHICWAAWRNMRDALYHRLLFCVGLSDILSSTGMLLHPWLLPAGTPNLFWARGTDASCLAVGFCFVSFFVLVAFYNCYLSLMFLLTIRYKWREVDIQKRLEKPAHALAMLSSLFVGLSGVFAKDGFKPRVLINICFMASCSIQDLYDNPVSCPGQEDVTYAWVVGWVFVALSTINTMIGATSTFLVYRTINAQTKSNRAHSFHSDQNATVNQERRSKEVLRQAVSYTLVYCNSFIWFMVAGVLLTDDVWVFGKEGEPGLYAFQIGMWLFLPSQGLLNFLVYTRPVFLKWRRTAPYRSRLWALWKAASMESPPRAGGGRRLSLSPPVGSNWMYWTSRQNIVRSPLDSKRAMSDRGSCLSSKQLPVHGHDCATSNGEGGSATVYDDNESTGVLATITPEHKNDTPSNKAEERSIVDKSVECGELLSILE